MHVEHLQPTVGGNLGPEASDLAGGKLIHARTISVVHKVICEVHR